MRRFDAAHISDLERVTGFGVEDLVWLPVRQRFGISAFGVNAYVAERAGQQVVEEHTETDEDGGPGHEELYVVLQGRAAFTIEGEELDAPAGTLVCLRDPTARRSAVAREPGTTVLAIGGRPGEAYAVSAWEYAFRGLGRRGAGEREAGRAIFDEGIARHPGDAALHFNLACFECGFGELDAAMAALRRAVELEPHVRVWAADDDELAPLRGREDFAALVATP